MRARLVQLEDEKKKMEEHTVRHNPDVHCLCGAGFLAHRVYFVVCILLQAKAEKEFQSEPEQPIDAEEAERVSKEADSRSVYVGNVDYDCTPEELQRHFQVCISATQ